MRATRPVDLRTLAGLALACGAPFLVLPGRELSGRVVSEPAQDRSSADAPFVPPETRPDTPSWSATVTASPGGARP